MQVGLPGHPLLDHGNRVHDGGMVLITEHPPDLREGHRRQLLEQMCRDLARVCHGMPIGLGLEFGWLHAVEIGHGLDNLLGINLLRRPCPQELPDYPLGELEVDRVVPQRGRGHQAGESPDQCADVVPHHGGDEQDHGIVELHHFGRGAKLDDADFSLEVRWLDVSHET